MVLYYFLALFCVLPALASIVLWKSIQQNCRPFIYTIWLAVFVEIIGIYSTEIHFYPLLAADYNIFIMLNIGLFLRFFYLTEAFSGKTCFLLFALIIVCFVFEYLYNGKLMILYKSSLVANCIIIVGCTKILPYVIFSEKGNLLKNFLFTILVASIIMYSFSILQVLIGWIIPLSKSLTIKLSEITFFWVNALSYLIIFYGLLCLKLKK